MANDDVEYWHQKHEENAQGKDNRPFDPDWSVKRKF
jgi:hypothetical protein